MLGLVILFSTVIIGCQTSDHKKPDNNWNSNTMQSGTAPNGSPKSGLVTESSSEQSLSGTSISDVLVKELKQNGIQSHSLSIGQIHQFNNVYIVGYTYEQHGNKQINVSALRRVDGKYISTSHSLDLLTKVVPLDGLYSFNQNGGDIKTSQTTTHWYATFGLVFDKHVAAVKLVFSDHVSVSRLSSKDRMYMDATIDPKFSVIQEIDFLNSNMKVIRRVKR